MINKKGRENFCSSSLFILIVRLLLRELCGKELAVETCDVLD